MTDLPRWRCHKVVSADKIVKIDISWVRDDDGRWYLIGEAQAISPNDLYRRGWEYLGPCNVRPYSRYIDS